ncbi:MAG: carcinine hydrolase/isopenicillin-N N-acyltransferase family protein, partial [Candidatus Helarchaeota archaeon]
AIGISQITSDEVGFGTPMGIIILDTLFNTTNTKDAQQHIVNGSKSTLRHAGAWCYMIVDKYYDACIIEVTHILNHTIWYSESTKPYLVITNHFVSPEMIPHNYVYDIMSNSYYRKKVLEEYLLNKENFDLKDTIETLRSRYDIKIQGDPGYGYENCVCNEWYGGTMHAFAAIVSHNYSLICLTNPKRGPFYVVSFTELIGPIA